MKAIQSISIGNAAIVSIPEPELQPNTILVRPLFVGNNPCDYVITDMDFMFKANQMIGSDYCGIVSKIGADVKTDLQPGDKVVGAMAAGVGCELSRGSFAELIPAYGDFCWRLPENVSEAQGATLGVGISTIAVAFYEILRLPLPIDNPTFGKGKSFFVYGGSSAMGLWGIQFAKLSGFRVITTCSPKNFGLVKEFGADEVFDYHDVEGATKGIKEVVGDELEFAYVCAIDPNSAKLCADVISSKGGTFCTIVMGECPRDDVKSVMTYGQSVMCSPYLTQAGVQERTPETKTLGQRVWSMALKYLEEGKLKTTPIDLRQGLEGALSGIDDLRHGRVSGKKIVSQL